MDHGDTLHRYVIGLDSDVQTLNAINHYQPSEKPTVSYIAVCHRTSSRSTGLFRFKSRLGVRL